MSYSDYRLKARRSLEGKWVLAIVVTVVAALCGGLITNGGFNMDLELDEETLTKMPEILIPLLTAYASIAGVLSIIQFIAGGVIRQGYASFLLKLHDGEQVEFNDLFSQFHRFKDGFLLSLLQGLFILLWALLFIIPGIVAAYSYAMAPYIMLEHPELSPRECLSASKEMMKGHKGELFILELTFIGWEILCAFTLGIGNLWLNPYMNATIAAFYRDISNTPPKVEVIE